MFKDFKLKIKNYVTKLQSLSENKKKIILWATVVFLGLIMGYFWVKSVIYKLNNLENIDLEFPELEINNNDIKTNLLENSQNQNIENINITE
jgi:cell division protein FtsL